MTGVLIFVGTVALAAAVRFFVNGGLRRLTRGRF